MIRSSADILRILQSSAVISGSASSIVVVDKKPMASGREGFFVHIERYPTEEEFQVVWRVWIESDGSEPDDLILAEMKRRLPGFSFKLGLLIEATVREFKTADTKLKPAPQEAPPVAPPAGWLDGFERSVERLVGAIHDGMLLSGSGRAGRDGIDGVDGKDGADGRDGRDGKDLLATSAMLDDLQNVTIEERIPLQKGQVLTYNGETWENLFVPQTYSINNGRSESTTTAASTGTSVQWKYHGSSNETEPQSRHFHSDTSDTDAASVFHVSKTNNAGNDVELLLDELLRTATRVYVSQTSDPSIAHLFQIDGYVETTTGYEISVTHIETAGPEVDFEFSKVYEFLFLGQNGSSSAPVSIDDLTDVDTTTVAPQPGQTLVWNGTDWVPGNFASNGGISDAPADGNYYVRQNGTWVNLGEALALLMIGNGGQFSPFGDGGDFTANYAGTAYSGQIDGSNVSTGSTGAADDSVYDGGYWS